MAIIGYRTIIYHSKILIAASGLTISKNYAKHQWYTNLASTISHYTINILLTFPVSMVTNNANVTLIFVLCIVYFFLTEL